ncbi:glycine betaine ABC transporter substrate-binding protein [Proteocatella sphenisci]|uniref:glycine betaine ABC transporter substrate-binding protein n=1 Tax=Proteocatella sphenisci TaxID=181070 RepID=UPI0004B17497|nr:glycine betaine ABC transporter substrate-binding protein [Proteocatella sphenisci]
MKNNILNKKGIGKPAVIISLVLVALIVTSVFAFMSISQKNKDNVIKIATKPMTEQFILGEMLAMLIEDKTDLSVELTKGIGGGTANIQPAILSGEFDMYPEYTGTGWLYVLKKTDIPDDQTLYKELVKDYQDEFGLEWLGLYGFNNTYGLIVRNDIAQEFDLSTYSDLAKVSKDLTFGAEYDFFEREDGYDALDSEYGFNFKKTVDLDIGLKYDAINKKQIDAMNIFTTDGQLSVSDVKVLEDDKAFYENYYCGTVVRKTTLEMHPELRDVLMLMDNLINEDEMAKMNYLVESENADEKTVAREFLVSKGLIE